MSKEIHPSREAYSNIWKAITIAVEKYNKNHPENILKMKSTAEEDIWNAYVEFNEECRTRYMSDDVDRIDRHKVCACYIYAIIKSGLIEYKELSQNDKKYLYDEKMAVTIGASLLRSFVIAAIDDSNKSDNEKKVLKKRIENGVRFPRTNHGDYRTNFEIELYYTKVNNTYNILGLANVLYLLETVTLDAMAVNPVKKKIFKWL